MKLFVRRTGGRIGLWGGLLAAALAAFAAGWLVPVRAPVGCKLNELTAAPDFSPFSPAAPVVAASDAGTPAAPSLPEKWVCLTFDDGPSKTTPAVLAALDAAGMSADVTRIEFADVDEMAFLYQDRISVWLGTLNELEYKLKLAKHVLLNEDGKGCAATDTGKLDFTHISMSSTRKFTFAQGEPELPSGYILPEPVEETPAEEGVTGETAEGTATDGTATDGTAPAEGEAAADAAAETPTDTAAAPAGPEAGQTAQPTPAEGTTPAAGDANQTQTTQ